jgi:hypothetical protein
MMRGMDLAAVAAELYALPPAGFTAARNARAKESRAAGQSLLAKQVARLARPTAAAWAVNRLARDRPDALARVLGLGAGLRDAQEALDAVRLRELGQQRTEILRNAAQLARSGAEHLGVRLSDAAATEVEQTLRAAMADTLAAEAVRSGLLVRALASNGLEPVDLAGAVAVPSAVPEHAAAGPGGSADDLPGHPAPQPDGGLDAGTKRATRQATLEQQRADEERRRADEERRRARAEAEAEAEEAEQALRDAEAELEDAQRQASDAATRAHRFTAEIASLRTRLEDLEDGLESAEREAATAERALRLAGRLVERERRATARARERLDSLGDCGP